MKNYIFESFRVIKIALLCIFMILQFQASSQKKTISRAEYLRWEKYSQKNDFFISAYSGYGSYSMRGLSSFQSDLIEQIGINAQVNSDFPSYWLYGITLLRKYDAVRFGFNFEQMSTGARSSLSDYSGQFYSDIICKGTKLGVIIEKDFSRSFFHSKKLVTGLRFDAGGLMTNIDINTSALVYDVPNGLEKSEMKFGLGSYYIEPAIYANYPISKQTSVQMSVGVMLNLPIELRMYLDNLSEDYRISWVGYRLHLGIMHRL